MTTERYFVGHAGNTIALERSWSVLDVGSGNNPHPRATTLLERFTQDNRERAGDPIDRTDPRLVEGDALAMPFDGGAFDYIIASHIAEHVQDPEQLCRELSRVGRAGYIETPGWLGDLLLREDYHHWRVRRQGRGLRFDQVTNRRPLGDLGEAFYFIVYYGEKRGGHGELKFDSQLLDAAFRIMKRFAAHAIRWPIFRGNFYTSIEWTGSIECHVNST